MTEPLTARPAEPFADVKARAAAAVEAARDEILDLSHRIHANPEPAFEEHKAAAWVAEAVARHGYAVEHPAGRSRRPSAAASPAAWARTGRGSASSRSTTRCPGWATAAATTRWPRPGWGPRSRWPRSGTSGRARSCSWAPRRRSGGAARRSCSGTACSRASTRRSCSTPATATAWSARRSRPRTSRVFTGLQSHAASEPWPGKNALDAMISLFVSVGLWRQQLPPHCRVHGIISGGRHRRQHHPGPDPGLVHDPQRRPALLRGHEGPLPPALRGGRPGDGRHVEVEFSGGASTMKHN